VFLFFTLYTQNVLGYTPIRGGSAYLPVTAGIAIAAAISARMFARTGTRPVIVAGSLIAAAGIWYLSRIPVHGSYPASLLPGLVIMAIGLGAVLVSVTTAANAGVAPDQAGLAAGLRAGSRLSLPRRPRPHSRAGTDRLKPASPRPRGPGPWPKTRPQTTPAKPPPGLTQALTNRST
jgi:hypothetical protein